MKLQYPEVDTQLITAAAAGEDAAWSLLYKRYYPQVYALALRYCGNRHFVRDMVQDVFMQAFLHLPSLRDAVSFGSWLRMMLIRRCYRAYKRPVFDQISDIHAETIADADAERHIHQYEQRVAIAELLGELPEMLRATVILRYFTEFDSYSEIADILAIPVGTVRSRLHQARRLMTERWNTSGDGQYSDTEARYWDTFYAGYFNEVLVDSTLRARFFHHFHPDLHLIYTSGKTSAKGRNALELLLEEDVQHGTIMTFQRSHTNGRLTVIEARSENSPQFPDRCPPSVAMVLWRNPKSNVVVLNLHNSPKKISI